MLWCQRGKKPKNPRTCGFSWFTPTYRPASFSLNSSRSFQHGYYLGQIAQLLPAHRKKTEKSSRAVGPWFLVSLERLLCENMAWCHGVESNQVVGGRGQKVWGTAVWSTWGVHLPYLNLSESAYPGTELKNDAVGINDFMPVITMMQRSIN